MTSFFRSRVQSFEYAARGWWHVVRTQRNAWIESVFAVLVVLLAFALGLSARDWAILVLTIALVFIAELLNTAMEAVVDLASPERHPLAKVAKDVGAGAVLLAATAAVVIGLLILGPPLWRVVSAWFIHR